MSDLDYLLALNSLSDVGPVLARRLLSAFGNAERIFQAGIQELKGVEGIGESRARSIARFNQWDRVEREIERAEECGVRLITIKDRGYPESLRRAHGAPVVLYLKGRLADTDKYAVAIVGSRKASAYGIHVAEKISNRLAAFGVTVVSGMARGIDTAAHEGALRAGGRTIAILGSGVDVPYPSSNRGLMKRIILQGAVLSEFPLGMEPKRENFPARNRIISALSLGIIVIEAALDSGSLITVGYALEQGKEVFAVPGNITSANSSGTNSLIKKGAQLVESAEEVIDELSPQLRGILSEEQRKPAEVPELSNDERMLFGHLTTEPKHIDAIIRETDIATGKAMSILLNLELKGVVIQSEGKHYCLNER